MCNLIFLSLFPVVFIYFLLLLFLMYFLHLSLPPLPLHPFIQCPLSFPSLILFIIDDCFTCTGNSDLYCKWGAWSEILRLQAVPEGSFFKCRFLIYEYRQFGY